MYAKYKKIKKKKIEHGIVNPNASPETEERDRKLVVETVSPDVQEVRIRKTRVAASVEVSPRLWSTHRQGDLRDPSSDRFKQF